MPFRVQALEPVRMRSLPRTLCRVRNRAQTRILYGVVRHQVSGLTGVDLQNRDPGAPQVRGPRCTQQTELQPGKTKENDDGKFFDSTVWIGSRFSLTEYDR